MRLTFFPLLALVTVAMPALAAPIVPPTDPNYGTNCSPPGGNWQGLVGLPSDVNDVIQDSIYTNLVYPCQSNTFTVPTDGVSDCYANLQWWLANVPAFSKVILPPGYFFISRGLNIANNYVVLSGAASFGLNETCLGYSNYVASGNQNPTALSIASSATDNLYGQLRITNTVRFGSNWFAVPLNDNSPFCWSNQVYQHSGFIFGGSNLEFVVTDLTDPNLVATNGWAGESLLKITNTIAQVVRVGADFGTNGAAVFFTNDLPFCWSFTNAPMAYPVENPIVASGLEHICVANLYTNKGNSGGLIDFAGAQKCFATDVIAMNTSRDGFFVAGSYLCQFQNLYLRYADFTDSGDGYGLHFFGPNFGCLFEDASIWGFRHSLIGEGPNTCCGWAYCWCIGDNNYTESMNWITDDALYHASCNLYCFQEGCFFHHSMTDFVHGCASIHPLWFRCLWNMAMTNSAGNPPCLAETNLPVPLGQFQGSTDGLPYLYNFGAFSCEQSNKYSHIVGSVMDLASVSNFPNAAPLAVNNASVYDFRFGWGGVGGGEGGNFSGDLSGSNTFYADDTFSHVTGTNQWFNGPHAVPASCYLASQPGWWNPHSKWPPVTPESSPMLPTDWSAMPPAVLRWLSVESNFVSFNYGPPGFSNFVMHN